MSITEQAATARTHKSLCLFYIHQAGTIYFIARINKMVIWDYLFR